MRMMTAIDLDSHRQLRQLLAVAVVKQKRQATQEAALWRAKEQKLESELEKSQQNLSEFRQWATSALTSAANTENQQVLSLPAHDSQHRHSIISNVFLPPLKDLVPIHCNSKDTLSDGLQQLQGQLSQASAAAAEYGAAKNVLDGRATALSSMLITNVNMLQHLHHDAAGAGLCTMDRCTILSLSNQVDCFSSCRSLETACSISRFIKKTLVHVPKSLLSMAYMQQCATVLAAALSASHGGVQLSQQAGPGASLSSRQDDEQQQCAAALEAMLLEVISLGRHLMVYRRGAQDCSNNATPQHNTTLCISNSHCAVAAAEMLQQLSNFPCTALLLCLAASQHLQEQVAHLQEACAAVLQADIASSSSSLYSSLSMSAEQALAQGSYIFQALHHALSDMEDAVQHIPVWGAALASASWTSRALEDLVASVSALYKACAGMQPQQSLLAVRICDLCAKLATSLQQLAATTDVPGMKNAAGATLRSAAASLCVKLRDLFLP